MNVTLHTHSIYVHYVHLERFLCRFERGTCRSTDHIIGLFYACLSIRNATGKGSPAGGHFGKTVAVLDI